MEKKNHNEELQSRCEFFKKTAKGALPILGISLFGPSIFASCEKDDDDDNGSHKGNGGNGGGCGCGGNCSGSCDDSCSGNCDGCSGSCFTTGCTAM